MLWLGIAVIAFPALSGWGYVALFSPIFVFILLNFVSGVPLLEKHADEKWGGQAEYEAYKASTPVLFPRIP
jgi:steroid 5-alpha reductase family enzyme